MNTIKNGSDEMSLKKEREKLFFESYMRSLNMDAMLASPKLKFLNDFKNNKRPSTRYRLSKNCQKIKGTYVFSKTQFITTCFKAERGDDFTIYGYMYSTFDKPTSNIEHLYVSFGPTFRSQDGEYRSRFQLYEKVQKMKEVFSVAYDTIEELLLQYLENDTMRLHCDIFYPQSFSGEKAIFESNVNNSRMAISLYVFSWLVDFHNIHKKIAENHLLPSYLRVIYDEEDVPYYEQLIEKIGEAQYMEMLFKIVADVNPESPINNPYDNITGQKIIPITVNEIQNIMDIMFRTWREVYASIRCSNLLINLISPSFPFFNDWFFIQNANPSLYDNFSQLMRYQHSEIAKGIAEGLREIDKKNFTTVGDNAVKVPVDFNFEKLSRKINSSIKFTESNIIIANEAICVHSEYVGRTMLDLPTIISNKIRNWKGLKQIFSTESQIRGLIFGYMDAIHCMNTKLDMVHGDLHLNNLTLMQVYETNIYADFKNPKIVYVFDIGENPLYYAFEQMGFYPMIIDYSRAFFGNYTEIADKFGDRFAEIFFKVQRDRIMNTLFRYFPTRVTKDRDSIMALLIENMPIIFKAISCIDVFSVTTGIEMMLTEEKHLETPAVLIEFISRVKIASEKLLLDNLRAVISRKYIKTSDFEWPTLMLIREFFSAEERLDMTDCTVVDVFNHTNSLKYNSGSEDELADIINPNCIINLIKQHNPSGIDHIMKRWTKYHNTDDRDDIDSIVDSYKRDDPPVQSSWMYE